MAEKTYRLKATQSLNLMSVRAQIVRCSELGIPATPAKLAERLTGSAKAADVQQVQKLLDAMLGRGLVEEG